MPDFSKFAIVFKLQPLQPTSTTLFTAVRHTTVETRRNNIIVFSKDRKSAAFFGIINSFQHHHSLPFAIRNCRLDAPRYRRSKFVVTLKKNAAVFGEGGLGGCGLTKGSSRALTLGLLLG